MRFYARIICILGFIFVIRLSSAKIEFPRIRTKSGGVKDKEIDKTSSKCQLDCKASGHICCQLSDGMQECRKDPGHCPGHVIKTGPSPKRLPSFKAKPAPKAKSGPSSPSPKRNPSVKPKPFPKAKTEDERRKQVFHHFRAIDNDKNGKITLKELNASRQHPASKDPNGPKFDIKKEFERMDEDKNGVITLHEVDTVIYSQNHTQNNVHFTLADVGASECTMPGWTSIKNQKECKMAYLKLNKTHRLFKNSKFVNASGNGNDLPFGCIWDNVSPGKEKRVYMNSDGKTISKDPKLRAICKKDKASNECKNKPCGEPCIQMDGYNGLCNGKGFCVSPETNPCAVHGCDGKKCGDRCLRDGDIMGFCDKHLNCDYFKKPCEEPELRNCLGYLDKQLPEQCQISKSEEKKCHEWLRKNKNTFQKMLESCLLQRNGQKHKTRRWLPYATPASCKACIASAFANGFPEFTNCEDRLAARATCGANHQCMSQRCSQFTSGKKCARCQGSGAQACGTDCDDDDKCCSGSCTCGNDGAPSTSGTRCC